MTKVLISWSGGKDSAMALYELQKGNDYKVVALLTTVTQGYDRISMHGVRRVLLERQAQSLGLALEIIPITQKATNEEYETKLKEKLLQHKAQGVGAVAIGDIFLEDLRKYREENLARVGMKGVFPVWGRKTSQMAKEFIDLDFKAIITCVDSDFLGREFCGREYDHQFLSDLPSGVAPAAKTVSFIPLSMPGPSSVSRYPIKKGRLSCAIIDFTIVT